MTKNAITWIREDFRIEHNPALAYATQSHENVAALYIYNKADFDNKREAQKWWLSKSLEVFQSELFKYKINLQILEGDELEVFSKIKKKDDVSIYWNKIYEPDVIAKGKKIRDVFKNYGMYKKWASILRDKALSDNKKEDILDKYLISIFGEAAQDKKSIDDLRQQALEIKDVKQRAKFAKQIVSGELSQTEKIEFLKDLFKGEKAYILSCGPTLTDHDSKKIKDILYQSKD